MGIKIFTWRKRSRNLKKNSLPISGMDKDCTYCVSSSARKKEALTCDPTDYYGFNVHAWNASKTALLDAEQAKARAIMEIRKKTIL